MHPYFHMFGRDIPAYWAWGMLGLVAAAVYLFATNRSGRAGHIPADDLAHCLLLACAGAMVGAKLLYLATALPLILEHRAALAASPALLLGLLTEGFVFYGGLLGGLFAVVWYCRRYGVSLAALAGLAAPAVPLFHAFGRVGCFFAGCCWGVETPGGLVFHESLAAPNGVPLLPVQLMEAAGNLLLFAALAAATRRMARKWLALPLYLAAYAALRFALEFLRGDALRGVAILSTSQWISLALLAAAGGWLARVLPSRSRPGE